MQEIHEPENKSPLAKWMKRFGLVGFIFFFVKGLLWLTIPALLIWLGYTW